MFIAVIVSISATLRLLFFLPRALPADLLKFQVIEPLRRLKANYAINPPINPLFTNSTLSEDKGSDRRRKMSPDFV